MDIYELSSYIVTLSAITWLYIGILGSQIPWPLRTIMICIGMLALISLSKGSTFECRTGESSIVLPSSVLRDAGGASGNVAMQINGLPEYAKVIYWTDSMNGGIVTTTGGGVANITISCLPSVSGSVNRLGINKELPALLYFRYEIAKNEFSSVQKREISVC